MFLTVIPGLTTSGDGVKPNKKMAATWFRKAEEQGARLVQMQWIWKEKYDNVEGISVR